MVKSYRILEKITEKRIVQIFPAAKNQIWMAPSQLQYHIPKLVVQRESTIPRQKRDIHHTRS